MSELDIDPAVVRRVAVLARLGLPEAELDRAAQQLQSVLGHFRALQAVDTTDIEPLVQALDQPGVTADDVIVAWPQPRTSLLSLTGHAREGFFVVPRVLDADFGETAAAPTAPALEPDADPGADA